MTTPIAPDVSGVIESLHARIDSDNPNLLVQIHGEIGSGKSLLLHRFRDELRQSKTDLWPILISPPAKALDAGPIAIAQMAAGLKAAGGMNGEFDQILFEPGSWSKKLNILTNSLERHADRVILLVDGADNWKHYTSEENLPFAERFEDVLHLVKDRLRCRRILTTQHESASFFDSKCLRLESKIDAKSILADGSYWGSLANAAAGLWQELGDELNRLSIVSLRLLVALSAVIEVKQATIIPRTPFALSQKLATSLQSNGEFKGLAKAWAALSLLRTPFGDQLVKRLGALNLTPRAFDLLSKCLLSSVDNELHLHSALRIDGRKIPNDRGGYLEILSSAERENFHGHFAQYYRDRFRTMANDLAHLESAIRFEMEAFYHASMSHDPTSFRDHRVFFSDQLNMLGKLLSWEARDYHSAAIVFESSLHWDSEDDYANHYRAWNLDLLGRNPDSVAAHYRKAVDLAPDRIWWWSRWICFLITLGRTREAEAEWYRAQDFLDLSTSSNDASVYTEFHSWVARILLHRGQLRFARLVLESIPNEIYFGGNGQFLPALKHRLQLLLEVQSHNAVFPPAIDREAKWDGPHINSRRNHASRQLTAWMPARVERVEGDKVFLYAATPPDEKNQEPEFGELELAADQFNRWSYDLTAQELTVGQFLEIGFYGANREDAIIRVYPDSVMPRLPILVPDPVRYLRREGKVRDA